MSFENSQLAAWRERVREEALRRGFSRAGFTTAEPIDEAIQRRWERWRKLDRAGEMDYLMRESPRRTHPRDLLPEAQCVIVVAADYYQGDHPAREGSADTSAIPELESSVGRSGLRPDVGSKSRPTSADKTLENRTCGKIARYAWGEDYHRVIRARLEELAKWMETDARENGFTETVHWRAATDSAPLDERALAFRAGLGFIGKNTLLLHPERGSWFLLGELLISIPFPPDEPLRPSQEHSCGNCRRCLEVCPTGALLDAFDLDPRRCISYLTIEQRGAIPEEFGAKMEGWAFGCDLCQEVCPFNRDPLPKLIPEFDSSRGAGAWFDETRLNETPSGKAFEKRWKHTPLDRAGRKGMKRNLEALKS